MRSQILWSKSSKCGEPYTYHIKNLKRGDLNNTVSRRFMTTTTVAIPPLATVVVGATMVYANSLEAVDLKLFYPMSLSVASPIFRRGWGTLILTGG